MESKPGRPNVAGRWYLIHPLLVAAYPVIFLFAQNASDQVTLAPLWLPLGVAMAGTAAAMLVLALLLRDFLVAALLTTLGLVVTFGYGHAWNLTGAFLGNQLWLLAAAAGVIVLGVATILFLRGRPDAAVRAAKALTILAAAGVALNGASAASQVMVDPIGIRPEPAVAHPDNRAGLERPDVYYIILDRYARGDVLEGVYGFDNRPFLDALAERGFYVATESYANYHRTPLSLVSSLSMDYLDGAALRAEAGSPGGGNPIDIRMRGHLPVPMFLKDLGYRYIHLGGEWEPSATNADADVTLRYAGFSQFASAVFETTIFGAVTAEEAAAPWSSASMRANTLYQFGRLAEVARAPGPKYVFAHLLIPHPPYVFDSDGSIPTTDELAERGNNESYVRQVQYANDRTLAVIDELLADDADPIVILQADEGPWPHRFRVEQKEFQWEGATDDELREKIGILNAYRLPGDAATDALYPGISPVNSFRVVFNAYFGTELPMLPERHFVHVDTHRYYDFIEVTDRLRD